MRRKMVSLAFVSFVVAMAAAVVAPMMAGAAPTSPDETASLAVQRVAVPGPIIRDEAAMVLVGSALIGLAAVVRRAA